MAKAVKLFAGSADLTFDKIAAVRADGVVFMRIKKRYGHAWSRWRLVDAVPSDMNEIFANDVNYYRTYFGTNGELKVRLPNWGSL